MSAKGYLGETDWAEGREAGREETRVTRRATGGTAEQRARLMGGASGGIREESERGTGEHGDDGGKAEARRAKQENCWPFLKGSGDGREGANQAGHLGNLSGLVRPVVWDG